MLYLRKSELQLTHVSESTESIQNRNLVGKFIGCTRRLLILLSHCQSRQKLEGLHKRGICQAKQITAAQIGVGLYASYAG